MAHELRATGHRVIVRPDRQADEMVSAAGIVLPGAVQSPSMSGVVIALGDGPKRDAEVRADAIADCLAIVCNVCPDDAAGMRDAVSRWLIDAPYNGHDVQLGDRVVFSAQSGHEIVLDDATHEAVVILTEDDILAIVEGTA